MDLYASTMPTLNADYNVTTANCNGDNDTNATKPSQVLPPIDVLYYTLEVTIAILAVAGNFVVLLAYACNKRLRIVSHYHLISLAMSDFMMGAVTIPLWLAALQGHPKNHFSCLFALSLIIYIDLASVFSLLVMTFDRYIFICWPLHYNILVTSKRSITSIITSWSLAAIFVLPMPLKWNWSSPDLTICYFVNIVDMRYLVFVFFACILPPIAIMTFMYIHILAEIHKQKRRLKAVYAACTRLQRHHTSSRSFVTNGLATPNNNDIINNGDDTNGSETPPSNGSGSKRRVRDSEFRIALMFLFLLLFFVVTWVPMFFIDTLMYFNMTFSITTINYTVLLSHCNSSFNPFLYRFQSDFQKIFMEWLCGSKQKRERERMITCTVIRSSRGQSRDSITG